MKLWEVHKDVYDFYKMLLDNHGEILEEELKNNLIERLKEDEPEDDNA